MNGNFEVGGYNEFTVKVNENIAKDYSSHQTKIGSIVNSYNGRFDCVLVDRCESRDFCLTHCFLYSLG